MLHLLLFVDIWDRLKVEKLHLVIWCDSIQWHTHMAKSEKKVDFEMKWANNNEKSKTSRKNVQLLLDISGIDENDSSLM